jgi:hypothetical protein
VGKYCSSENLVPSHTVPSIVGGEQASRGGTWSFFLTSGYPTTCPYDGAADVARVRALIGCSGRDRRILHRPTVRPNLGNYRSVFLRPVHYRSVNGDSKIRVKFLEPIETARDVTTTRAHRLITTSRVPWLSMGGAPNGAQSHRTSAGQLQHPRRTRGAVPAQVD